MFFSGSKCSDNKEHKKRLVKTSQ